MNMNTSIVPTQEHYLFINMELVDTYCANLLKNKFTAIIKKVDDGSTHISTIAVEQRIRSNRLYGMNGDKWRVVQCDLRDNPIDNLSHALGQPNALWQQQEILPDCIPTIRRHLNHRNGLAQLYYQAQENATQPFNLLIVITNFSNLFRYESLLQLRERNLQFISLLLTAVRDGSVPIYVSIDLEERYLFDITNFRGLVDIVNTSRLNLPHPHPQQIATAIDNFIANNLANYSKEFVEVLQKDILADEYPESLLLRLRFLIHHLSHEVAIVDQNSYQTIGKISSCIDNYFTNCYNKLDKQSQQIATLLFKLIIKQTPDGDLLRYPLKMNTALSIIQGHSKESFSTSDLYNIMDSFNQGAVKLFKYNKNTDCFIIDLADEVIISTWSQLRTWIEEENINISIYKRLVTEALIYQNGKGNTGLYQGRKLESALSWFQKEHPNSDWANRNYPLPLPNSDWAKEFSDTFDIAIDYLQKSEKEHLRQQTKIQRAEREKLKRAQRTIKIVSALAIFAIVALCVAIGQYYETKKKSKQIRLYELLDNLKTLNLIRSDKVDELANIRYKIQKKEKINNSNTLFKSLNKENLFFIPTQTFSQPLADALQTLKFCIEARKDNDEQQLINSTQEIIKLYHQQKNNKTGINPFIIQSLLEHQDAFRVLKNAGRISSYEKNISTDVRDIASNASVSEEFAFVDQAGNVQVCYQNFNRCYSLRGEYSSTSITFSPDGEYLFLGNEKGELYRWNLKQYRSSRKTRTIDQPSVKLSRHLLKSFSTPVMALSTSDHPDFLMITSINQLCTIHPETGKTYSTLKVKAPITTTAINPEGNHLLISTPDNSYLHRIVRNKIVQRPSLTIQHTGTNLTASVINDKKANAKIVLGTEKGKLWVIHSLNHLIGLAKQQSKTSLDALAANKLALFVDNEHTAKITNLVFNPFDTSSELASTSLDGTVRLVDLSSTDLANFKSALIFTQNNHSIMTLDFKNEDEIVAGSSRELVIWTTNPDKIVKNLQGYLK